ncbi:ImmA/IrrE family metallo-endopeptidase [Stutzerimonas stutzeri]|uniref:ImmA/IrrE family metallo-endopeptidase n=1 Tax=Stutzerimonas stutzeri TaxID=316 RepID=UPI000C9AE0C9|nr:ImmA/IrrE family metallo-endopeptidase [Stutzerimonas stutzeri]PNG14606.1 hypothetical protein CXK97_08830 [Stutzerimonas stutzeri]
MSIHSTLTAAEYAKKALSLVWDGTIPVNPAVIARSIYVYDKDQHGNQINVPIRVEGKNTASLSGASGQASLVVNGNDRYFLCEYNSEEIVYRTRFTIAHELGHILLGHVNSEQRKWRDTNFTSGYDPAEAAANSFAAELIMPEVEVRKFIAISSSVDQLAETFGVSTAAMTYRLKNLRLLA